MLNGECRQWRNNSCCMPGLIHVRERISNLNNLETNQHLFGSETTKTKFKHNHCGEMSEQCLVLMYRQWCLYQCDPYLEPWIINRTEVSKIFLFLPIKFHFSLIQQQQQYRLERQ